MGGYVLYAACLVLSFFAVREFYNIFDEKPIRPVAYVSIALLYGSLPFAGTDFLPLWVFVTVALCLVCLFRGEIYGLEDSMVTMAGIFYVVFFLFHVVLIGHFFPSGTSWIQGWNSPVWLVPLTAFGTDIFAYFVGNLVGRHKLCPKISPKKTVEGSVGGIVGSALLCGVFGYFALPDIFVHCIVIGVLGGVVSQVGDLVASVVKRRRGVKDYGRLIPGHGGILDRIDSVLFTAPLVFYYMYILAY
jgi:phosphatidate cytidylyltransferase